jgi:hypothetical protein
VGREDKGCSQNMEERVKLNGLSMVYRHPMSRKAGGRAGHAPALVSKTPQSRWKSRGASPASSLYLG